MKRKTGNGTRARQYLYIMLNLPFFWKWKIGISGNAQTRAKSITNIVPGRMVIVFAARVYNAYAFEQFLLRITNWNATKVQGVGGKEFRGLPGGLIALLLAFVYTILDFAGLVLVGMLIAFLFAYSVYQFL